MSDSMNSVLGATQALADTTLGYLNVKEQQKANQQNYDIALKNLGLSEEQMKYMRALQERMFERDDNSISRMVKDLENNGFNKLLAFGTGGLSNSSVSMPSAPKMEYRYQPIDYSALKQNLVGTVADMENLKNIRTQRELMENQSYGQTLNNVLTELKAKEDAYNLDYYSSKGLPTNATGIPKIGAEIEGMLKDRDNSFTEFVNNLIEKAKANKEKKEKHNNNKKTNNNKKNRTYGTSINDRGNSHLSGSF